MSDFADRLDDWFTNQLIRHLSASRRGIPLTVRAGSQNEIFQSVAFDFIFVFWRLEGYDIQQYDGASLFNKLNTFQR